MKKIIKEADEKRGIIQVTIADERFYLKSKINEITAIPEYLAVPSVTWITQSYPKGIAYFKWLADKGWDESEAIKNAAGDKGSKVHLAIEAILRGEEVRIDSKFMSKNTGQEEELTLEECDAIQAFIAWRKENNPELIASEIVVFSDKHGYAGTVDFVCKIGEDIWIVDFKTSQYIWPSHELQLSAYKQTIENGENTIFKEGKQVNVAGIKLGILQLGYRRNKNGYKFTEVEDQFPMFLAAKMIWFKEHGGENITKKDYPVVLSPRTKTGGDSTNIVSDPQTPPEGNSDAIDGELKPNGRKKK